MSVKFKQGQVIAFGGRAVMKDATATPQTSPVTVDTDGITLAIPTGALAVNLYVSTTPVRVGVDADLSDGYAILAAGLVHRLPVADGESLTIKTGSGSDDMTFWFEIE